LQLKPSQNPRSLRKFVRIFQASPKTPSCVAAAHKSGASGSRSMIVDVSGAAVNAAPTLSKTLWWVTDGLSKGIVKLAGKAVRDYNDAYGQDRISLLAVLPWKWVPSRSELVSKDFTPCQDLLPGLDPNHNFFLMVDDNAETDTVVSEVRTRIETLLSRLDESMPQRAGLLHPGQRNAGRYAWCSATAPLCWFAAPAAWPTRVCYLLDLLSGEIRIDNPALRTASPEVLASVTLQKWLCGDQEAPKPEVSMLMEIAAAQHLIEVFSVEDDMASDFDAKILASLLGMPQSAGDDAGGNGEKAAGEDSEVLNVDSCASQCPSIAATLLGLKILTDAKKWTPLDAAGSAGNQTEFRRADGGAVCCFSLNAYVKDSLAAASSSALWPSRSGSRASPSSASTSHHGSTGDVEAAGTCYDPAGYTLIESAPVRGLRATLWCCLTGRCSARGPGLLADSVQMRAELDLQAIPLRAARLSKVLNDCWAERGPPGQHDGFRRLCTPSSGADLLRAGRRGHFAEASSAHPSCQNLLDMMWRGRIVAFCLVGLLAAQHPELWGPLLQLLAARRGRGRRDGGNHQ
uniref:LSDAT_euk domain-containing protein n=1 Tax=Macrostomum lignano TaxID=282301 RepID=A0A1I8FDX0_9PLAT